MLLRSHNISGNSSALAEAMRKVMLLSPSERKRMGEAGRRRVEEHFRIERVVDRWEEVYRKLLESRERLLEERVTKQFLRIF